LDVNECVSSGPAGASDTRFRLVVLDSASGAQIAWAWTIAPRFGAGGIIHTG
jgi:hypothetical protein